VPPLKGLHQTLATENAHDADMMNAVVPHTGFMGTANHLNVHDMDDSVFWGPVDDSFKRFMELDWDMMSTDAEVMHWAL
jgi:hypothetical protein